MQEALVLAAGSPSLMDGWIPVVAQLITVATLARVVGWRMRRRRRLSLPLAAVFGALAAGAAYWALATLGLASEPAPWQLWWWVALSGFAMATMLADWPGTGWARRNLAVFAASLCLLCTGLTVNGWIGYVPTVSVAWNQLTAGALPDETDWAKVVAMQHQAIAPNHGAVLRVDIDSAASGFAHREELVYLPPAWFRHELPRRLPTIMMIGGQFNTPADWLRAGNAVSTLDAFAAAHDGNAPVAVFVDPSGAFTNDTECVNGPRGNAADHLTKDVVPQMIANFGVSPDPQDWGVVGFSTGGTCALDLVVMHPTTFGVFVDIAGDLGPNAGTKTQSIDRLFGGDEHAWAAFDPTSVMVRHGRYTDVAGLFVAPGGAVSARIAHELCAVGTAEAIECTVVELPGRHVWPFADTAFASTLPWLAGKFRVPGADSVERPPRFAR